MRNLALIFLITLSVSANSQKSENYSDLNQLSTPEESWLELLRNLKIGSSDSIKAVVTENGFECLIKYISPYNESDPFTVSFRNWGNMWSNWDTEWGEIKDNRVKLKVGQESKDHVFTFLKIGTEWKMEYWDPY